MPLREPRWWYAPQGAAGWRGRALRPIARLYGAAAQRNFHKGERYRSKLPVICVGNFTSGGTGKTPLTLLLCQMLRDSGLSPAVLTRGYGGRRAGPHWVSASLDIPYNVGDEPLLLAAHGPVLIARDRAAGAREIENAGTHSVIVMDDGMLNGALVKDLSIAVIDGMRGAGNGEVIPAGPLRAPLDFQLGLVDCIVVNGGTGDIAPRAQYVVESLKQSFPGPVLVASVVPEGDMSWIAGQRVIAYAGIGNPDRFFDLVTSLGGEIVTRRQFGDHHRFSEFEARELLQSAQRDGAILLTTQKDLARLAGATGARAELKQVSRALPVRLDFDERDDKRLEAIVAAAIARNNRA